MLYILEGCDGAGKTTVATKLAKVLDAEIIHCSQYTPNDFSFFVHIAEAAKEKNIIADRFCYGQFVYQEEENRPLRESPIVTTLGFGDRDGVSALKNLHQLETIMLDCGVKVIYVTAPVDDIKERLALRGEVLINGLTVEDIMIRYTAVRKNSILPWIEWNTGGEE